MATCYSKAVLFAFKSRTNLFLPKPQFSTLTTDLPTFNLPLHGKFTKSYCGGVKASINLDPPDVTRLAQTAHISLTPQEVKEFGPKIQKVVDWFGQLQAVDLDSVEPAIRSDIDGDNLRVDEPLDFDNREAIVDAIPSYDEPYIKVPRILHKEN